MFHISKYTVPLLMSFFLADTDKLQKQTRHQQILILFSLYFLSLQNKIQKNHRNIVYYLNICQKSYIILPLFQYYYFLTTCGTFYHYFRKLTFILFSSLVKLGVRKEKVVFHRKASCFPEMTKGENEI